MTLNTRNHLLMAMNVISAVIFAIFLVGMILFCIHGMQSQVPELPRNFNFHSDFFLVKDSIIATMISLLVFPFYASIFGLYVYLAFEKTKAPEIVYLSFFFIGCILQSCGILIAILNMWNNTTHFVLVLGRIMLSGRIMSAVAILLITMYAGTEGAENMTVETDRNIGIGACLALFVANIVPLNTTKITSAMWIKTGFDKELFILLFMVICITIIVYSIYQSQKQYKFFDGPVLYITFLLLGYAFLILTDTYLFLALGISFFFGGTYGFLKYLREKYRWN